MCPNVLAFQTSPGPNFVHVRPGDGSTDGAINHIVIKGADQGAESRNDNEKDRPERHGDYGTL